MWRPLVALVTAVLLAPAQAQQIPNGGFESWADRVAYEEVDEWRSGNYQIPGLVSTTRVAGHQGTSAARMTTVSDGVNTNHGLLLHGGAVNNQAVDGVPFSTAIDALEGWFRYDMVAGDSALIYLLVWSGGAIVDTVTKFVGGTQLNWTAFSFPVNNGVPVQPDSVLLAFVSSNPYGPPIVGTSWLEVDGIQLTSVIEPVPDELPNNGLEDWHDRTSEEPDGWFSFNPLLLNFGLAPVSKSTNARTGNYSLRMETLGLDNDTLPGIIANSDIANGAFFTGVPYADTPTLLTGFYQYAPVGMDTAAIYLAFVTNGQLVYEHYGWITAATSTWTFVGASITLFTAPDTLIMRVWSGNNPGSVLHLDDLAFVGITLGEEERTARPFDLFPQPAADLLYVRLHESDPPSHVRLFDASGRLVHESAVVAAAGTVVLSVEDLVPGMHIIELEFPRGAQRARFLKK